MFNFISGKSPFQSKNITSHLKNRSIQQFNKQKEEQEKNQKQFTSRKSPALQFGSRLSKLASFLRNRFQNGSSKGANTPSHSESLKNQIQNESKVKVESQEVQKTTQSYNITGGESPKATLENLLKNLTSAQGELDDVINDLEESKNSSSSYGKGPKGGYGRGPRGRGYGQHGRAYGRGPRGRGHGHHGRSHGFGGRDHGRYDRSDNMRDRFQDHRAHGGRGHGHHGRSHGFGGRDHGRYDRSDNMRDRFQDHRAHGGRGSYGKAYGKGYGIKSDQATKDTEKSLEKLLKERDDLNKVIGDIKKDLEKGVDLGKKLDGHIKDVEKIKISLEKEIKNSHFSEDIKQDVTANVIPKLELAIEKAKNPEPVTPPKVDIPPTKEEPKNPVEPPKAETPPPKQEPQEPVLKPKNPLQDRISRPNTPIQSGSGSQESTGSTYVSEFLTQESKYESLSFGDNSLFTTEVAKQDKGSSNVHQYALSMLVKMVQGDFKNDGMLKQRKIGVVAKETTSSTIEQPKEQKDAVKTVEKEGIKTEVDVSKSRFNRFAKNAKRLKNYHKNSMVKETQVSEKLKKQENMKASSKGLENNISMKQGDKSTLSLKEAAARGQELINKNSSSGNSAKDTNVDVKNNEEKVVEQTNTSKVNSTHASTLDKITKVVTSVVKDIAGKVKEQLTVETPKAQAQVEKLKAQVEKAPEQAKQAINPIVEKKAEIADKLTKPASNMSVRERMLLQKKQRQDARLDKAQQRLESQQSKRLENLKRAQEKLSSKPVKNQKAFQRQQQELERRSMNISKQSTKAQNKLDNRSEKIETNFLKERAKIRGNFNQSFSRNNFRARF